ncbi:MAG: arylsulfatase [Planctomycetota bacterium]|jgi:arylsulfatase A-like enzyme
MAEKQTRRGFLKMITAAGALSILPGCNGDTEKGLAKKRKPNVVLVITDDQGYGDLGCHGNKIIKTPNMDRLHGQSLRLTNFHVESTCAPTRAALMTGRYCNRTGVWHTGRGRSLLREDEKTMADVFSAAGYKTGIFGKWHLGDNFPFRPQYRGFDEVLIHGGGGVRQTPDYWGNDYFNDTYFHNGKPQKYRGYCTDVWFDGAMKFIKDNKDRAFFCYLSTNAPHQPFYIAQKYINMYKDNKEVPNPNFYGMITNIDKNLSRLRKKLKSLGLEENTIFIFMTDNGTAAGVKVDEKGFVVKGHNAGMRGKKSSEYDGGHRVPCFIYWPGGKITGGKDIDRITAHVDMLPTLIDLCGLEKQAGIKFDGISLKPLLTDQPDNWPDRTLVTDHQRLEEPVKWRKSATMTDRWRLINGRELYDMQADPGQHNDLAEKFPDVVTKLRAEYEKWWTSISERFDEYCEIVVGSKEDPVLLTCHDWHGPIIPWNQIEIRQGMEGNGFWAVRIARAGEYEFELRRWPVEADVPIAGSVPAGGPIPGGKPFPAGTVLEITKARLKIANVDMTKTVQAGAKAVKFRAKLKTGSTRLQSWFIDNKGKSRGAYYVYVKRLD